MGAGDYNQPIVFETPGSTPDGYGGTVLTWTQVGNRTFASIQPVIGGGEREAEGALRSPTTYAIKLLRREDITASMRIRWQQNTVTEILNIRNIRRGAPRELTMTIIAESGVTQ
jgi:SPP1 family predicted phage head-tail adaptor